MIVTAQSSSFGFASSCKLLSADLLAECVRAEEGISQGYSLQIDALSADAHIPLKSLLGQPALLELLTATSRDDLRPFHGHITKVAMNGPNGGFARYTLTIEPWTAFLAHGSDSRIFQDMTVFAIIDAMFEAWQGQGTLAPAWRFDIADEALYPRRSLTTQYHESDLAFIARLLHEEGLFYFFEHTGDAESATLGSHTVVIADHNSAFKPNAQASVNFTQPGAVMKVDSIDRNAPMLTSRGTPGAYAYSSREQGQRIADRQVKAQAAARQLHVAAGTVRTLSPGTTFTLHSDAQFDGERFAIVRAMHLIHNNLSARLW